MEKIIGYAFVGGTLLLAAADGALGLLILAALLGGGTYLFLGGIGDTPGFLSKPHQAIYEREKAKIQVALDAATDKDREEIKRVVTARLESLKKTKDLNEVWDKKVAGCIGVAVFASPVVSVGLLGYVLYRLNEVKPRPEFRVFPKIDAGSTRAALEKAV